MHRDPNTPPDPPAVDMVIVQAFTYLCAGAAIGVALFAIYIGVSP